MLAPAYIPKRPHRRMNILMLSIMPARAATDWFALSRREEGEVSIVATRVSPGSKALEALDVSFEISWSAARERRRAVKRSIWEWRK